VPACALEHQHPMARMGRPVNHRPARIPGRRPQTGQPQGSPVGGHQRPTPKSGPGRGFPPRATTRVARRGASTPPTQIWTGAGFSHPGDHKGRPYGGRCDQNPVHSVRALCCNGPRRGGPCARPGPGTPTPHGAHGPPRKSPPRMYPRPAPRNRATTRVARRGASTPPTQVWTGAGFSTPGDHKGCPSGGINTPHPNLDRGGVLHPGRPQGSPLRGLLRSKPRSFRPGPVLRWPP